MEIISDKYVIQRLQTLILSDYLGWKDHSTALDRYGAKYWLPILQRKYGADNVRLVRYVTTMEVVSEGEARHA